MLVKLYKIGQVYFCLLGTNGFHVKAGNKRFSTTSSRCHQNLKFENFTSLFGILLRKKIAQKACRTCSTIIFHHSTNQIIDFWRCRFRCHRRCRFLNSLLTQYTPKENPGFDFHEAVICMKHWRLKEGHIFVNSACLSNLLATTAAHVETATSFRLIRAPYSLASALRVEFLLRFIDRCVVFSAYKPFGIPVQALV